MYISYQEAEKLYIMYPTIQSILESLQMSLKSIAEGTEIDDTIYTLIMGNKKLEGTVPTIGNVSDSTGNLAIRVPINEKITSKELSKDVIRLSTIIQKINLAIKRFSRKQTTIMQLFYWGENGEKMTWDQVVKKVLPPLSVSSAKQERRCCINVIVGVGKITMEDFVWVVELIKGNGGGIREEVDYQILTSENAKSPKQVNKPNGQVTVRKMTEEEMKKYGG